MPLLVSKLFLLWFLTELVVALFLYDLVFVISSERMKAIAIISTAVFNYTLDKCGVPKLPWNIDTTFMAVLFIKIGYELN